VPYVGEGPGSGDGQLEFPQGREKVKQLIEARGCELIYLPPYSPDFNPIEQAFNKLKSYLREACARTQQTLMELIGEALHTITVSDAEGFLAHCGYRAVVQSL
jgi:transposase